MSPALVAPDLEEVLATFTHPRREHLIPILQAIQERFGFLSPESMIEVGRRLDLPVSKIYGVATFYNQFRFQPIGRVHCQVCRGTACHVKGSLQVLDTLRQELGIEPGQTTRDGNFSIEVVACIGACGLAPVITTNAEFHADMQPDHVRKLVKRLRKEVEGR